MRLTIRFSLLIFCILHFEPSSILAQEDNEFKSACHTEYESMPVADIEAYVTAMQSSSKKIPTDTIIIPLVIHNLTWNRIGYIPDEDFVEVVRKINDRLANRGEGYDPLGVDTKVRVCLANTDPYGNPTNGIVHLEHPRVLEFERSIPSSLRWNEERYLNAFVYDGDEGWAYPPWSYSYMMLGYERARLDEGVVTWVHEIGHVLGLFHTFEGICATVRCHEIGDMVCDTGPDQVSFSPCFDFDSCSNDYDPNNPDSWIVDGNSPDMIENYMDGGLCRTRFTIGQVERMHWALQTYRPGWDSKGTLCSDCLTIPNTQFDMSHNSVDTDESVTFFLEEIDFNKYDINWYIDNIWYSSENTWTTIVTQPGTHIIRLEIADKSGDCAGAIWSKEQVLSVHCAEDELLRITLPERMIMDSCYTIEVSGVSELSWAFEDKTGSSSIVEFCPKESGLQEMEINYGSGTCRAEEKLHYMVYPTTKRERSYFHQSMRFDQDSTSSQDFMKMYEYGDDAYRIAGLENYAKQNFSQDTNRNFVRTWFPFDKVGYEWELYQDTLPVLYETDQITNLQIVFLDIVEDTLDGSKYFLGWEHYATRYNSVFLFGKLNVLGTPIWTKRIQIPEFHFYEGKLDNNKYIHFLGDTLLLNFNHILCKMDRQGKVLDAVGLKRSPSTLYDRPMNSDRLGMSIRNDKIFYNQKIDLIDTSLYPIHTDSIWNIRVPTVWSGILNENLELESSTFFNLVDEEEFRLVRNSFTSRNYKQGSLIFWMQNEAYGDTISATDIIGREAHLLYVDEFNTVLDYKVIGSDQGPISTKALPFLHVLKNDKIVFGYQIERGRKLEVFNIDRDWETIISNGYEILNDSIQIENAIENYHSGMRRADQASVLTQDGILAKVYSLGSLIDKNNFYLLPFENDKLDCTQYSPSYWVKDAELQPHRLQPEVEVVPTRIETEEIYLKRRTRTFTSETICENRYELEDYKLVHADTNCIAQDLMEISVEVCRDITDINDTISVHLYEQSPLAEEVLPSIIDEMNFVQKEQCSVKKIIAPKSDYHILINAKLDYQRPYTLKKTFFDGHEKMEYDYTNNLKFVSACENSVSAGQAIQKSVALNIYPNPSYSSLNISTNENQFEKVEIYNSLGIQVYASYNRTRSQKVSLVDWIDGLYFIKAKLKNGTIASGKFMKTNQE